MSCKSALYMANTATQTVAVGGTLNFGNVVRRFGCNCNASGGDAVIDGTGYYDVTASFSFTADGAGTTTISLLKDGVLIPGAFATFGVASGGIYTATVHAIVRQTCNCESVINATLAGESGTFVNASITVEKI